MSVFASDLRTRLAGGAGHWQRCGAMAQAGSAAVFGHYTLEESSPIANWR